MDSFRVTALLASRDDGDIVVQAVEHLIAQGVQVYFIDHESSDPTLERIEPLVGEGVVAVERFPQESPFPPRRVAEAPWESVLRRKEQLAAKLESDWFIHQDADEFRESPWEDLSLADAIRRVDEEGYNAIDFEVLEFPPVGRPWSGSEDLFDTFPAWRRPRVARPQIRCWKKVDEVDLVSSGGHDADFARRRVYPVRFPMRHYPVRSPEHGREKFAARARQLASERHRGWHAHYEEVDEDTDFVVPEEDLEPFDPTAVRAALTSVSSEGEPTSLEDDSEVVEGAAEASLLERWKNETMSLRGRVMELERESRLAEATRDRLRREHEHLEGQLEVLGDKLARLTVNLEQRDQEIEKLVGEKREAEDRLRRRDLDLSELEKRYRDLEHELADARREQARLGTELERARASAEERPAPGGFGGFLSRRRRK